MASSPPLATKAPENDGQSTATASASSLFPQDSLAQSGPSMGTGISEHCTSDRLTTSSSHSPTGELTNFKDTEVYISKPADYPHSPSKLLLLLTSGTGVKSINNQRQADRFASEGFVVVMPDQFGGDPAPNTATAVMESDSDGGGGSGGGPGATAGGGGGGEGGGAGSEGKLSLIEQVKLRAAETAKSFMLDMWLARHTAEKVLPILHQVLESAKDEFADAVANGGGVYAAGYCFGAKYVMNLAGASHSGQWEAKDEDEEAGMVKAGPLIKAGAIAHATLVTREDVTAIEAPLSMVCVENDQLFPDEILEAARKYLQTNSIDHEIKTYPGVPHGFAVLGDYADSTIQRAQTEAFAQMLAWLKTH